MIKIKRPLSFTQEQPTIPGIQPIAYWNFDDPAKAGADSICQNEQCKNIATAYGVDLEQGLAKFYKKPKIWWTALAIPNVSNSSGKYSFEFLLKVDNSYLFQQVETGWGRKGRNLMMKIGGYQLSFVYYPIPVIYWDIFNKTDSKACLPGLEGCIINRASALLNGEGISDPNYLFDTKWHHFVTTYDGDTGLARICIDGQCPPAFSNINTKQAVKSPETNGQLLYGLMESYASADKPADLLNSMDQIAVYDQVLDEKQIYQHYKDAVLNGTKYSFALSPERPSPSKSISSRLRCADYFPGFDASQAADDSLSSEDKALKCGKTVHQAVQLKSFPSPRYKENIKLMPLMPWGNVLADFSKGWALDSISSELCRNWNYYLAFTPSGYSFRIDHSSNKIINIMNNHPECHTAITTFTQFGATKEMKDLNLPDEYYMHNKTTGKVALPYTKGMGLTLSPNPAAPSAIITGNNENVIGAAGYRNKQLNEIDKLLNRKIEYLSDNGETPPSYSAKDGSGYIHEKNIRKDIADFYNLNLSEEEIKTLDSVDWANIDWTKYATDPKTSGLKETEIPTVDKLYKLDWNNYMFNNTVFDFRVKYFDQLRSHPVFSENAVLSWYDFNAFSFSDWNVFKTVIDYGTFSLYPHYPYSWRGYNGWTWTAVNRDVEQKSPGKHPTSFPFVSTSWNTSSIPTKDFTPGQYLGLLKSVVVGGAESFNYFDFNGINDPVEMKIWKLAVLSYAQAIGSQIADDFLFCKDNKCPKLLEGDFNIIVWGGYSGKEYSFFDKNFHYLNLAKISANRDKLLIYTTKQQGPIAPNETVTLNFTRCTDPECVRLVNDFSLSSVTVPTSRQGSLYVMNLVDKSLVQYDSWHKDAHPWYWFRNIQMFEAELADEIVNSCNNNRWQIATDHSNDDYSNFNTYLELKNSDQGACNIQASESKLKYKFDIKSNQIGNYAVLFKLKLKENSEENVDLSFDGTKKKYVVSGKTLISNIADFKKQLQLDDDSIPENPGWNYYFDNSFLMQNLTEGVHNFELQVTGKDLGLQLDKIYLVKTDVLSPDLALRDLNLNSLGLPIAYCSDGKKEIKNGGKPAYNLLISNQGKAAANDVNYKVYMRKKGEVSWQEDYSGTIASLAADEVSNQTNVTKQTITKQTDCDGNCAKTDKKPCSAIKTEEVDVFNNNYILSPDGIGFNPDITKLPSSVYDNYNYIYGEYEIKAEIAPASQEKIVRNNKACYKFEYYPLEDCTYWGYNWTCGQEQRADPTCRNDCDTKFEKCGKNIEERACVEGKNDEACAVWTGNGGACGIINECYDDSCQKTCLNKYYQSNCKKGVETCKDVACYAALLPLFINKTVLSGYVNRYENDMILNLEKIECGE